MVMLMVCEYGSNIHLFETGPTNGRGVMLGGLTIRRVACCAVVVVVVFTIHHTIPCHAMRRPPGWLFVSVGEENWW